MIYLDTFIHQVEEEDDTKRPFSSLRSRKRMRSAALNALQSPGPRSSVSNERESYLIIWMSGVYSKRWWIEWQNIDQLQLVETILLRFQWMEFPILPFVFGWWWNVNRTGLVYILDVFLLDDRENRWLQISIS